MKKKYNYLLTISYDGTNYSGWQIQPKKLTIQSLIEKALFIITKEKIKIYASGRTDANVHAIDQKASFKTSLKLDLKKSLTSLNGLLPNDIKIMKIEKKTLSFHARFSAKSKIYRYYLSFGNIANPLTLNHYTHIFYDLDIDLMKESLKCFLGTHNFKAFANKAHQGAAKNNPIKTIKKFSIKKISKTSVYFEIEADGFLYKMVRNIIGTIIEVGKGKMKKEEIIKIINSQDRKKAKALAPAKGLFLYKVKY